VPDFAALLAGAEDAAATERLLRAASIGRPLAPRKRGRKPKVRAADGESFSRLAP